MGNCKNCFKSRKTTEVRPLAKTAAQTAKTFKSTDILLTEVFESDKFMKPEPSKSCDFDNIEIYDAPSGKIINKSKTDDDIKLIIKAFSKHFLFSYLPADKVQELIIQMKCFIIEPNQIIFQQGNPGHTFFILAKGTAEIIVNGLRKGFITEGYGFGELALLNNTERTATIKSLDKVTLWGLDRKIFRQALKTLNTLSFEENKNFAKNIPFLQVLNDEQLESLLEEVVVQYFSNGQKIVIEGDPGDLFYIIKEGQVECSIKGKVLRVIERGEYFGEMALLYDAVRSATITAVNKVSVLSFGRNTLLKVLGEKFQFLLYKNALRIAFDKCQYLSGLTMDQVEILISKVEFFSYDEGEIAIPQGNVKNKHLWVVLKGSVSNSKKTLSLFENIGGKAIHSKRETIFKENFYADNETDLGMIKRDTIESLLGNELSVQIEVNKITNILKRINPFGLLSCNKISLMAQSVVLLEYKIDEVIFKLGEPGDSLYIIKEGQVEVYKDNQFIRTLAKGSFFGERSILMNETRTASIISKAKTLVWKLSREKFMEIVDENFIKKLVLRISLQDDSIQLNDLVIVDLIGKGTFGNVYLCCNKKNRMMYALKSVTRKKINFHSLQESLKQEKKVLQQIEHQFIIKLVKTFKDTKRIYFLLEYVQGLSLFEVLRILNLLKSSDCRFYTASLLIILDYLHKNSIIYRDLKPENLMVDHEGYLKLLDFGRAKIIKDRTFSVIGTPQYMAPEVIMGKGYNFSADLWSVGIMIYEFICGNVPFGGNDEDDAFTIYREILSGEIKFPSFIKDNCREKQLIETLLNNYPPGRGTAEKLKLHKYFKCFSWDGLLCRDLSPPYIPKVDIEERTIETSLIQNRTVEHLLTTQQDSSFNPQVKGKDFFSDWDKDF